jgi:hypothetical protein
LKEFELDFFSKSSEVPYELPEKEKLSILAYIQNYYPKVGKVLAVFSFGSLDINSRNIKIVTELGVYTLKFWEKTPRKRLDEVIEILLFLQSKEMRIPTPVKNFEGEYLSGSWQELASLFYYVEGEMYQPNQDNLRYFFEATGQLFTNLSMISEEQNLSSSKFPAPGKTQNSIRESLKNERLWTELDASDLQECLISLWPFIKRDLDLFAHLNPLSKLQYSHYDLHPKNVVFDNSQGFGFLDFASCANSNPNIAWGFLLIKNLRQAVANSKDHNVAKVLASKSISDIEKISFAQKLDVLNLPIYGRYEIARRLAFILDDFTKNGGKTWLSMMPVQVRLLKESYLLFGDN